MFVPRASKLLSLQSHPVNMIHFSKLFQDQLITMSLAEMNSLDGNDAAKHAESSIVRKLETLDPEHWRKIQAKTYIPTRYCLRKMNLPIDIGIQLFPSSNVVE